MIFVDTWGFKAFIDRKERKHSEVKKFFINAWDQGMAVYTSDYVIDETITLISYKLDFDKLEKFINSFDGAVSAGYINLLWVSKEDFENAKNMKLKFKDKLDVSFTDMTSAVLMKKHNIIDVVTEDKHFIKIGMGFNVLF